jgi:mannose-6-phosphate isomerase-like protein (cupin superfamily)
MGASGQGGKARLLARRASSNPEGDVMSIATRFLRRDPAEVEPWAETCGRIRPLIEERDEAAAEVHHVEIDNARLHYHAKTDEIYYVIDGSGTMILDDEEIELHKGVVVYVPRGVRHKAVGALTVLTVCIPRGVLYDVHELE